MRNEIYDCEDEKQAEEDETDEMSYMKMKRARIYTNGKTRLSGKQLEEFWDEFSTKHSSKELDEISEKYHLD